MERGEVLCRVIRLRSISPLSFLYYFFLSFYIKKNNRFQIAIYHLDFTPLHRLHLFPVWPINKGIEGESLLFF